MCARDRVLEGWLKKALHHHRIGVGGMTEQEALDSLTSDLMLKISGMIAVEVGNALSKERDRVRNEIKNLLEVV